MPMLLDGVEMTWRAIQDTVPYSESLAAVSSEAERLYWRLVCRSDSWGRLPGSVAKVSANCVPLLHATDDEVGEWLGDLERVRRIQLYDVDGIRYLQLLDFETHQPPELLRRRGPSKCPEPPKKVPKSRKLPDQSESSPERSCLEESRGEEKRVEEKTLAPAAPPRARDEIWDALVERFGDPATKNEHSRRNGVVKQLRDAGATGDDVRQRIRRWPEAFPNATLTDTALINRWSDLKPVSTKRDDTFTDRVARGEEREHEFMDEKVIDLLKKAGSKWAS